MPDHTHDLAVEVQEAINAWRAGPQEGESTFVWVARSVEELAEAVHAGAEAFDGDREQVKAQATVLALRVFDEFIVPYDVPNLGSMIETWIEGTIRSAIPGLVEAAFNKKPAVDAA